MADIQCTHDLLALHRMPELGHALQARIAVCISRWELAVKEAIPDAEPLTLRQVRNSIPVVLEQFARALISDNPAETEKYYEISKAHGKARYDEAYDLSELIPEYLFLRCIVMEEVAGAIARPLKLPELMALNAGIDVALEQSILSFTRYQSEQLKASNETQARYLSFLAHDLRNNLANVTLRMEMLRMRLAETPGFAEDAEDLTALQRGIDDTMAGMERLLQAERLRKTAGTSRTTVARLRMLVLDVVAQSQQFARQKGLAVMVNVPEDAIVRGDTELVGLIVQNLLGNAIKYSAKGTIRINARLTEEKTQWIISVADEGPGIAPDRLERLFNAFTRGETHGQSGVGLGLAIASQAAQILGTELQVFSKLGDGALFQFRLPIAVPPPPPSLPPPSPSA